MAFLDPVSLTCAGCGTKGEAVFVVGIGPQTEPGAGPSTCSLHDAGPWVVETTAAHPFWEGRLSCSTCGALVLERPEPGVAHA